MVQVSELLPPPKVCDKCGRQVPANNNVVLFDVELGADSALIIYAQPRHLLPVKEGQTVICEGSPSRAQYLPGQPHDIRAQWPYRPECEELYREAYRRMQRHAAAPNN
jgi:hypothetical protein